MTTHDTPRFIARRQPWDDRFAIFDRRRSSWPLSVPGFGVLETFELEQDAAAMAERLAEFYAKATVA